MILKNSSISNKFLSISVIAQVYVFGKTITFLFLSNTLVHYRPNFISVNRIIYNVTIIMRLALIFFPKDKINLLNIYLDNTNKSLKLF